MRSATVECLIPIATGFAIEKLSQKLAQQPALILKVFKYFKEKFKFEDTKTASLIYQTLNLDNILPSKNPHTKNLYQKVLLTEYGAKAMDLLFKAQINVASISGKNFQRLANVLYKFGDAQNEALLNVLKSTRDFNRMFIFLDNMVNSVDEYVDVLAKIQSDKMFKKTIQIGQETLSVENFLESSAANGKYYFMVENGIKYFAKMIEDEGVVIVLESGKNLVISTAGNYAKETIKIELNKLLDYPVSLEDEQ